MTASKSRHARRHGYAPTDLYWQSASYNTRIFQYFRNQIIKLALSRFRWVNLPKSCDARYLELTLLFQGIATIAYPKNQKGVFYSTQVAQASPPNVYDNPTKWASIGNNGWQFSCNRENGVIVYDNQMRTPLLNAINLWAQELTDIRRTKQINRLHQKTPYIIKCAPEQEQQAINLFKQISGSEPAIIATDGLNSIDVDVIKTDVQFLSEELSTEELNTWTQIYNMLGIENANYKSERMVEAEIISQNEPTSIMLLESLNCRRIACNELNERFSEYLEKPVQCVKGIDIESDNFNFEHSLEKQSEVKNDGSDGSNRNIPTDRAE